MSVALPSKKRALRDGQRHTRPATHSAAQGREHPPAQRKFSFAIQHEMSSLVAPGSFSPGLADALRWRPIAPEIRLRPADPPGHAAPLCRRTWAAGWVESQSWAISLVGSSSAGPSSPHPRLVPAQLAGKRDL
jgi:hypothetical protein